MKELDQDVTLLLDVETYNAVVKKLSSLVHKSFKHINILDEVVNSLLIRITKMHFDHKDIEQKIDLLYPHVIEDLFAGYHSIAFRYCYCRTNNPDLSNDIAQETISLLLKSINFIKQVQFWIRKVAHNLLCEHYKKIKDEHKLYRDLIDEASIIRQITINRENDSFNEYEHCIPQAVLNGVNYISYMKLKQHNNLESYAKASNLSYEAAKSVSKKVIRNIKAEIMLALGWEASPDMLDYRQYKAVQCFIRKLLATANDPHKKQDDLVRIHPDLPIALDGYKSVDDWGISLIGERKFRLYLMHLGTDPIPLMTTVLVTINNRNHIKVESCKRNQHAGSHDIPANLLIPKEKGRAMWTYDRIVSLLNENNR